MKRILASIGALIAVIALALLTVWYHPIPDESPHRGDLIIEGQVVKAPFDVMYVDGLMDGGTMIFGLKAADGAIFSVICEFGDSRQRFQTLRFSQGLPLYDGVTEPVLTEILHDRELIRNVLYYSMKKKGFHDSHWERSCAKSLYPNLYERYVR